VSPRRAIPESEKGKTVPNLIGLGATTGKIRVKNQSDVRLTATPDGALYIADYYLNMALEGRLFQAFTGSGTSPVTFALSYAANTPQFVVDVPTATSIIPVRIQVYLEASASANPTPILAVTGTSNVGAGTSTQVTPLSTRTDHPVSSGCSVYTLYSVAGTAPANAVEFWHTGYNFADATGNPIKFFEWTSQQNGPPQIIVGPGTLAIYINGKGGTAPTGYARVSYIELPSSTLS
jgi:hypothetical protein